MPSMNELSPFLGKRVPGLVILTNGDRVQVGGIYQTGPESLSLSRTDGSTQPCTLDLIETWLPEYHPV